MRLKSIKLVGFKSFVDPTTASFPVNLTAVVGPNGCGKSNIIDAVRWVMGESSAKHLRGESMADVIFNGSNARKPVAQASIELVFDNSEGKLGGEYGKFSEVSIKRQVTRDGQSNYFLNGTKCRRKDITDIFLGTGLGPRSYAIIEQGMISRLIDAKPEDLRIYIEEAAGISKYKERRRETENRMRRTRENLERLTDIREEQVYWFKIVSLFDPSASNQSIASKKSNDNEDTPVEYRIGRVIGYSEVCAEFRGSGANPQMIQTIKQLFGANPDFKRGYGEFDNFTGFDFVTGLTECDRVRADVEKVYNIVKAKGG